MSAHVAGPIDRVEEDFGMTYRASCSCGWRDSEYRRYISETRANQYTHAGGSPFYLAAETEADRRLALAREAQAQPNNLQSGVKGKA